MRQGVASRFRGDQGFDGVEADARGLDAGSWRLVDPLIGLAAETPVSPTATSDTVAAFGPTSAANQAPVFTTSGFSIAKASTTDSGGASANEDALSLARQGSVYSPDGRFVVFSSSATNLVPGDTNGRTDIFVKSLETGAITRVSTGSNGEQAMTGLSNYGAFEASFSPDGSKVIFSSLASDLVAGDASGTTDIFVKDLVTGQLTRVTEGAITTGTLAGDNASFSPDGTKVVFMSTSSTLVAGDTNGMLDVFVKDLTTGAVTRVSTGSAGDQATAINGGGDSRYGIFSPDGQRILFQSSASLIPGQSAGSRIYIKDLNTGALTVAFDGPTASQAQFSPDGHRIVFVTDVAVAAGDTNGRNDVYVKDLDTGAITRVATTAGGLSSSYDTFDPVFSRDGRSVLFTSAGDFGLVGVVNNNVWMKNLDTGAITWISHSAAGAAGTNSGSSSAHVGPDGQSYLFISGAAGLVPEQTQSVYNVYSVHVAPAGSVDGAGAPFVENGQVTRVLSDVIVTDDNSNYSGGTLNIRIISGGQSNDLIDFNYATGGIFLINGLLRAGGTTVGSVTRNSGGDLSVALNANMTPSILQSVLTNIGFTSTGDNVISGTRSIQYELIDGAGTDGGGHDRASFIRTVAVTGINDGPFTGNTVVALKSDSVYVLKASDFLYSDLEGNNLASVRIDMANFNSAAGQLLYDPDGAGPLPAQAVTGVKEYAIGDFAAGRFVFVPVRSFEGYTAFNFRLRDDGGTLNGGVDLSNTAAFQLNVTPGNRAPVITLPGGTTNYVEGNGTQTSVAVFGRGLAVRDPDTSAAGEILSAVVQISGGYHAGEDRLQVTNSYDLPLVTTAWDATTGRLTITPTRPLGDVDWSTILGNLEYTNSSDTPSSDARTVTVTTRDREFTSAPVSRTLTMTATDDTPVMDLDSRAPDRNGFTYFLEGSAPSSLFPRAVFSDVDGTNLNGATLTLDRPNSPFFTGTTGIAATNLIGVSGSTISYQGVDIATMSGGGGTTPLTVTFNGSATLPAMEALVRAITYTNPAEIMPAGGQYLLTFHDASGFSQAYSQISPVEVPDAPVLDLNGAAAGVNTAIFYSPGQPSQLLAPTIFLSDADTSFGNTTLTVSMLNPSGGDNLTVLIGSGPGEVTTDEAGNLIINGQAFGFQVLSPTSAKVFFGFGAVSADTISILIRALGYVNDAGSPARNERIVAFTLTQFDNTVTSLATVAFPGGTPTTPPPAVTPLANGDEFTVSATGPTALPVLANDVAGLSTGLLVATLAGRQVDASNSATRSATLPSGAVVTLNTDGTVSYAPSATFFGERDFFSYGLSSGTSTSVIVHIAGVAASPLFGTGGTDTLVGSSANDTLYGLAGDDILSGGDGDDFLDGGAGADAMTGGAGNDIFYVDDAGDIVSEAVGGGIDEVRTTLAAYALPPNVERLVYAGVGAAVLTGNAGDNDLTGGASADLFRLEQGGNDSASGAGGDDGFYFGAAMTALDSVDGGAGNDQIALQGVYAGLAFGAGGTLGVEAIVLLPGDDTRFANLGGATMGYDLTLADANVAVGAVLAFQANTLRAGENFTLNAATETNGHILTYGGFGVENLTGGQADDGFYFGAGRFGTSDRVDGQGGFDAIGLQGDFAGANAVILGAGQISGIELINLLSGADTSFGGGGAAFSYMLTMNDGNVAAGAAMGIQANQLRANEVLTFDGGAELDGRFLVFGGAGADSITGGHGADQLYGGAGADILIGGGGADLLTGGAGNDIFKLLGLSDSMVAAGDTIADLAAGDRIDLSSISVGQPFHLGATAGHSGDVVVAYDTGSDRTSLSLFADGDANADAVIWLSGNHQDLATTDFIL